MTTANAGTWFRFTRRNTEPETANYDSFEQMRKSVRREYGVDLTNADAGLGYGDVTQRGDRYEWGPGTAW